MKSIHLYKTSKHYKIVTQYKLVSGSYLLSEPIYILPIDSKIEVLADKIYEALNTSRRISEAEEEHMWLGIKLLKQMKESSFEGLYRDSASCWISIGSGKISIEPYKYLGKGKGLNIDENRIIELDEMHEPIEVAKIVIDTLA